MKIIIPILAILCPLTANAQNADQIRNVKFLGDPEGILITIKDKKNKDYVRSCTTPCTLNLDVSRDLTFLGEKDGFRDSKASKTYHSDNLNVLLLPFNHSEFKQSSPTVKVTLSPKKSSQKPTENQTTQSQTSSKETGGPKQAVNYYCGTVPDKVVTKTPKPVKLAYPTPPSRAKTSGHCKVKFNVNYKGKVTHPETTFCTDAVFRKNSIKTIKRWRYAPSDKSQGEYQYCGLVMKISYGVFELKDGKLQ